MNALRESLDRFKLAYILAILIVLNVIRFWPHKREDAELAFSMPPADGMPDGATPGADIRPDGTGGPPGRERLEALLKKLSAEQRKVVEERMTEDRNFFDSIRDLPEEQRRQQMQEHFAQNPPAFPPNADGTFMPPPDGEGTSGPNPFGKGGMHLPPPGVRRSMDQQIANAQKKGNP